LREMPTMAQISRTLCPAACFSARAALRLRSSTPRGRPAEQIAKVGPSLHLSHKHRYGAPADRKAQDENVGPGRAISLAVGSRDGYPPRASVLLKSREARDWPLL
jgi:hypothetical protein